MAMHTDVCLAGNTLITLRLLATLPPLSPIPLPHTLQTHQHAITMAPGQQVCPLGMHRSSLLWVLMICSWHHACYAAIAPVARFYK
jgi:hypothetical protein